MRAALGRVPCFRGSFAMAKPMQNHRESMRTLRGLHAFAMITPAIGFAQEPRKHGTHRHLMPPLACVTFVTSYSDGSQNRAVLRTAAKREMTCLKLRASKVPASCD